jgi:DNA repair protein RecN (Recombination protein N)
MLVQLSIKNIVLIESCDIAFGDGLCVLSGETGAGKSILLDALGLVLGGRADASLVRRGEAQGSISAEFDITANAAAKASLAALELEQADTLILRRSLGTDGKTRCLANDQPVTVAALKKLGETLVEVHGQHDQRSLQDTILHRALLDDYGKLAPRRKQLSANYQAWREAAQAVAALQAQIDQAAREQDYLQHMHNELKALAPQPGEEETLADKRTAMMQSEKLFEVLDTATSELGAGKGAVSALRSAQRALTRSPLTSASALFAPIIEALERAAIETEEALYALEKAGQEATFNPEKFEALEERLFALKAAGRKYNLPVDELAGLYAQVAEKLSLIGNQSHQLGALAKKEAQAKEAFIREAQALSAERKKAAARLEKSVEGELKPLKMEGTHFRVRLETLPESGWSEWGSDLVHFECATNVTKGSKIIAYAPLSKIASGGELSRFMLAMKVALAGVRGAATIIFDEIDSGTGGAVADAIGKRLSKLGENAQVLVVTHLPQVAARGSQHLLVEKMEKAKKILTTVRPLSQAQRGEELARMLAGATITPEARKAAQKLLEEAA